MTIISNMLNGMSLKKILKLEQTGCLFDFLALLKISK